MSNCFYVGVPLDFFLSTEAYPFQPVTEQLTLVRQKNKWYTPLIHSMMGTITMPAIDLPTESSEAKFRLWGLTMGMTRDIIQFTKLKDLAFVKLTSKPPTYSRPDIGFMITCITHVIFYRNKLLKRQTNDPFR